MPAPDPIAARRAQLAREAAAEGPTAAAKAAAVVVGAGTALVVAGAYFTGYAGSHTLTHVIRALDRLRR